MKDFAKIYQVEGIGQILVTLALNDDGYSCVTFRIPDAEEVVMECSIVPKDDDVDACERLCESIFQAMTEELAIKHVKPLLKIKARIPA